MTILEIKNRIGKKRQTFKCEAIDVRPGSRAILRYISHRPYNIAGVEIPVGSVTDGYYWSERPYTLWRITDPDGSLTGHRFDVVKNVDIGPETVEYTDLVMDVWLDADGSTQLLDEDELKELTQSGLIDAREYLYIRNMAVSLAKKARKIVRAVGQRV